MFAPWKLNWISSVMFVFDPSAFVVVRLVGFGATSDGSHGPPESLPPDDDGEEPDDGGGESEPGDPPGESNTGRPLMMRTLCAEAGLAKVRRVGGLARGVHRVIPALGAGRC